MKKVGEILKYGGWLLSQNNDNLGRTWKEIIVA
jgi:hypothetical protein